jgi:hypothetical protein
MFFVNSRICSRHAVKAELAQVVRCSFASAKGNRSNCSPDLVTN